MLDKEKLLEELNGMSDEEFINFVNRLSPEAKKYVEELYKGIEK
jgi:pantothenate kinase-related protein Tda10